jgi:D-alanine-D-alanine ligase
LLDLPEQVSSLRVALVYNQKPACPDTSVLGEKEEATQQSGSEDSADPPYADGLPTSRLDYPSILREYPGHFSDRYAEWDTFETIDAVRGALAELHHVTLVEANEFAFSKLASQRPDIVFNIAEGFHGASREAQVPAICEMLQLPYTGSDPLTLAVCLDKSRAKEILAYHAIPTPKFYVVNELSDLQNNGLKFPSIVKPLHEGSSKGIFNSSLVSNISALRCEVEKILENYSESAIVEEYLPGREFTVAMIGNGKNVNILPIVEIKFDSLPSGVNPIYSYEAKWIWDQADHPLDIFECPAKISGELQDEIEVLCRKAFTVLRCRDWCRIDVRLDVQGRPQILELNPLPGILPNPEDNSCFPKAARAAGMNYHQLIQHVLGFAIQRHKLVEAIPSTI